MDFDGSADVDDIDDFVQGLHSSGLYFAVYGVPSSLHGDMDGDGDHDYDDIRRFVALLDTTSPEQNTAALARSIHQETQRDRRTAN